LEASIDRFAFVMTPLQIKGATGSISRPLAIV
jgi:kynurenine formamidase